MFYSCSVLPICILLSVHPSTHAQFSLGTIKVSWYLIPVLFLPLVDQPPGLSVHDRGPGPGLLPAVVVLHQAGDQLVWKLPTNTEINKFSIKY